MRSIYIFALCFMVLAIPAQAQDLPVKGSFGLGVMIGSPTGVNGKLWMDDYRAVDATIAWALEERFYFGMDYLFHVFGSTIPLYHTARATHTPSDLALYVGIGGHLEVKDTHGKREHSKTFFGPRFPFGAEWLIARIGIFVEIAPIFRLLPETSLTVNGGIGVRFYFWQ